MTCMVAQPAMGLLLTGGWDGTARLWKFEIQTPKGEPRRLEFREQFTFAGHAGPVRALAMSRVQPIVASGGDDGTIRLWRGAEPAAWRVPTAVEAGEVASPPCPCGCATETFRRRSASWCTLAGT